MNVDFHGLPDRVEMRRHEGQFGAFHVLRLHRDRAALTFFLQERDVPAEKAQALADAFAALCPQAEVVK